MAQFTQWENYFEYLNYSLNRRDNQLWRVRSHTTLKLLNELEFYTVPCQSNSRSVNSEIFIRCKQNVKLLLCYHIKLNCFIKGRKPLLGLRGVYVSSYICNWFVSRRDIANIPDEAGANGNDEHIANIASDASNQDPI
jgi:hypothetical protein